MLQPSAKDLIMRSWNGEMDQVWLIYNEFKSVVQQRVIVEPLFADSAAGAS